MASSSFGGFAVKASCAAFSGFARSLLTTFFWSFFSSAAKAGLLGTKPAAPTTATPSTSVASMLGLTFMVLRLVTELGSVDETDLLHPVALRGRQDLRHVVIL